MRRFILAGGTTSLAIKTALGCRNTYLADVLTRFKMSQDCLMTMLQTVVAGGSEDGDEGEQDARHLLYG